MSEKNQGPEETRASDSPAESAPGTPARAGGRDKETNQWAMFIHFSMLAGWVIPLAGVIVPIVLWQIKKDDLPGIVPHAYIVMNWIITSLLYAFICFILMFVLIGMLGFVLLGVLTLIYSIVGGVKANEGEVWEYPGTIIKLFK